MDWAVMRLNGSDRPLEVEKTGPSSELYDTKENISCMLSEPSFSIYHLQNTTIQMSDLGKNRWYFICSIAYEKHELWIALVSHHHQHPFNPRSEQRYRVELVCVVWVGWLAPSAGLISHAWLGDRRYIRTRVRNNSISLTDLVDWTSTVRTSAAEIR